MNFGTKEKYSRAWWDIKYPVTKCKCIDNFYIDGKEIEIITRSEAKCNSSDKFNDEFGKALSMVRCRQKANRKIEKLLIQYSNRNSEKRVNHTSGSIMRVNDEYYLSGKYLLNILDESFLCSGTLSNKDNKLYQILKKKLQGVSL